jgi:hypothetical protein
MTPFVLRQLRLESPDRYYLPLPKLTLEQMELLAERLAAVGYSVSAQGERLTAVDGSSRIAILRAGLAWSSKDMLDALAPSVPSILASPREAATRNPYFAPKRIRGGFEIQFFPRMEGLRLWTALRRSGDCGLTPDEKAVVQKVLEGATQNIECVTDYPTDGCSVLQAGRRQYYRSLVPASEFLFRLRTTEDSLSTNCYLPRSSVLRVKTRSLPPLPKPEELDQWCFVEFSPKSL